MPSRSAGLLLYRTTGAGAVEVLLGHMGGPFWARKDAGAWTLPKGEYDPLSEDAHDAAVREFTEELGVRPPPGPEIELGSVRQRGGKTVTAWARLVPAHALDLATVVPGTFETEWPPRSGRRASFPELDRVAWCSLPEARRLVVTAQTELVDRLERALAGTSADASPDPAYPSDPP